MHQTTLSFPEIKLQRRQAPKLRGYFAKMFGQESDLFHNHDEQGRSISRYPRIQYKVIGDVPYIVGIEEGAKLIVDRFLRIQSINIDGLNLPLHQKHLKSEDLLVRQDGTLYAYQFITPWFPLNQDNHRLYTTLGEAEREEKLKNILINNMISFFKAVKFQAEERIMIHLDLKGPTVAKFKNQPILIWSGGFVCNVSLPNYIGLGKSTARGYGTIIRKKK